MAFECPRRSSPPSPMFDADTGCIATDPAPSARRRFRSKTGIENLPANEHAQETPHTPSPTRTTRRIQSGCAGSRPRLRDGMPGSPSQHIDITRAKWIPYILETPSTQSHSHPDCMPWYHPENQIIGNIPVTKNQPSLPQRHPPLSKVSALFVPRSVGGTLLFSNLAAVWLCPLRVISAPPWRGFQRSATRP